MIPDAEIRRVARRAGVEPRVVELDYVLGWALWGLGSSELLRERLLFKGGTCLRKCYMPDYRFSEDLDFTALRWLEWDSFREGVAAAMDRVSDESGINFRVREPRFETVDDEYGRESLQARIYWYGPHSHRGDPRAIRLDINRGEALAFDPVQRLVDHPYSDADDMGGSSWPCYALEEVMAEKLRAILGQRKHAVSRDLYDIHFLLEQGIDEDRVRAALPSKLEAKELSIDTVTAERLVERKAEFESDWRRNLVHLVARERMPEFEVVWREVYRYAQQNVPGEG
jgi:predicted nucleotidyltransferase component of viral defense system